MKLYKLSALAMAMVSCAYLTAMPSHAEEATSQPQKKLEYPTTRTHQDNLDPFLFGEFGMSMNTANINHTFHQRTLPDDGIDHYSSATVVDKYRWLEEYDPIDPAQSKETSADRERNFIGTPQEDDSPLAAQMTKAMQTVSEPTSSEVNDWVNAQTAVAENYITSTPVYAQLKKNADSLMDREHTFLTAKKEKFGEFRVYRHVDGYRRIELIDDDGKRTEIVNERKLSKTGNAQMRGVKFSKDGSYVSFFVRHGNSDADFAVLHVVDTKTGELATPIITDIDGSGATVQWYDDDTFYYTALNTNTVEIWSRNIGKEKFTDRIIVPANYVDDRSIRSFSFEGDDKRYLVINTWRVAESPYIYDTKTKDMYRLHDQKFFGEVFKDTSFNNNILAKLVHFDPETRDVWIITGENDRRGEVIKTNLNNLKKREVVVPFPEGYDLIYDDAGEFYYHEEGTGYFVGTYLKDGVGRVVLIDAPTGKVLKDLTPAVGGFVDSLSGHVADKKDNKKQEDKDDDVSADDKESYIKFQFSSPTTPATDYKYSIAKDEFIDIRRHDLSPFDETKYETKLVFYTSKDGTQVPMNISYKKGIKLDGKNPTLLYGYGGYGVLDEQVFGAANVLWLENGGVWANAFIRGGGEYGEAWQNAAKHTKRLTGYDDFAAAADYLNQAGYASPEYLGITGGSNGGLLVGAAMVRHPEKYRVAVPRVGVFDQFRHDKMGTTQYWMQEYGTPEEGRKVYDVLKSYSPIHNLNKGTCYPSTLIDTSKRDDRVVPSHSYRFAATLQEIESCGRPALLWVDEDAGHSPNTYQERNKRLLMIAAFAFNEMGVTSVPDIGTRPSLDDMKTDKWRAEDALKEQKRLEKKQKSEK